MPDELTELRRLEELAEDILKRIKDRIAEYDDAEAEENARRRRRTFRAVALIPALITGTSTLARKTPHLALTAGASSMVAVATAALLVTTPDDDGAARTDSYPQVSASASPSAGASSRPATPEPQRPAAPFFPTPTPEDDPLTPEPVDSALPTDAPHTPIVRKLLTPSGRKSAMRRPRPLMTRVLPPDDGRMRQPCGRIRITLGLCRPTP